MFLQIFTSILTSCVQNELQVPNFAIKLWYEAARLWNIDTSDPSWRVQELAISLAKLRANLRNGSCCDSDAIVSEALVIDSALASVFEEPSPLWQYKTENNDAYPKLAYQCIYHVYSNDLVSQTWNSMRMCRILLNEIIVTKLFEEGNKLCLQTLSPGDQSQCATSMETLRQMTGDILGSVPQSMGYIFILEGQQKLEHIQNLIPTAISRTKSDPGHVAPLHPRFNHPSSMGSLPLSTSQDELPIMRGSSGCLLIWHLYHVGTMDTTTVEARQWIVDVLRFEGQVTGVAQATLFANILEKQPEKRSMQA